MIPVVSHYIGSFLIELLLIKTVSYTHLDVYKRQELLQLSLNQQKSYLQVTELTVQQMMPQDFQSQKR